MKYRDVIGFSKKKQKFIKKAITPTSPKPSITKKLKEEFGPLKEGKKLNEAAEIEDVQDHESRIFDAIAQFTKVFEKSEWKKNRKINSIIKQLFKLETQLGNETGDLD